MTIAPYLRAALGRLFYSCLSLSYRTAAIVARSGLGKYALPDADRHGALRLALSRWALINRDLDTAFAHLLAVSQQKPANPEATFLLGRLAVALHRDAQAEAIFYTIKPLPSSPYSRVVLAGLAFVLLRAGRLPAGYQALRSCVDSPPYQQLVRRWFSRPYPLWTGAHLHGKSLLVWSERGFGDAIHYLRFMPQIAARGVRVVLGVPPELTRLCDRVDGVSEVVTQVQHRTDIAAVLPFELIPAMLGVTWKTIPTTPYLFPPADVVPLPVTHPGSLRVGLVWANMPHHERAAEINALGQMGPRSLPPVYLAPLLTQRGVEWYSLQKRLAVKDLKREGVQKLIHDLTPLLRDFADTASVISQLDLVITVDTAVAHLAGALGKDVWVLLPYPADSRWLIDRTDSPWYPTMRLFRQRERGLWIDPISELLTALQARQTGQNDSGSRSYLDHRAILRPTPRR